MTAQTEQTEQTKLQAIAEILENAEISNLEYISPEELAEELENSDELDLLLQAQKELGFIF